MLLQRAQPRRGRAPVAGVAQSFSPRVVKNQGASAAAAEGARGGSRSAAALSHAGCAGADGGRQLLHARERAHSTGQPALCRRELAVAGVHVALHAGRLRGKK